MFTDLVGFSSWSLNAGRRRHAASCCAGSSQVVEPPLLEAGGQIVKRMGDGIMAVFADPTTAVRAAMRRARGGESR